MTARALLLALMCGPVAVLRAQDPAASIRLTLGEEFRVGRTAPTLRLPYVTARGAGPADQPFELRRELGRVVVLVFRGRNEPVAESARWQALAGSDSLFGAGVVVAGIAAAPSDSLIRVAQALGLSFKLLSDSVGREARRLGLDPSTTTAIVIGRDGQVRYREDAFPAVPLQPTSRLVAAVRASKEAM